MKTRSIKSAVYAAGVVFAPSEDVPGIGAIPRGKSRTKRRQRNAAAAYEAKYVAAETPQPPSANWWRMLDFGWLTGRATA
ncbi:MAG: hypothetical protein APF80_00390 [Alphaproteobacteria bacterium BRH_c36]|nr:MAG: hypothetical protein APF80_00390 [Alphaproteobacteria bacterium BRH_c36]